MDMTNVSGQALVFPDGTEVKRGESYKLTDADLKNVGVAQWIEDGWLADAKPAPKPVVKAPKE
jgi:hypothetical protein